MSTCNHDITLQAFHNLMTSYAPKRIGHKHDGYVARMEAAYIDHNSHLDREQMTTKMGRCSLESGVNEVQGGMMYPFPL